MHGSSFVWFLGSSIQNSYVDIFGDLRIQIIKGIKLTKVRLIVLSTLLYLLVSCVFAQMAKPSASAATWDTWIADADAIAAMVQAPDSTARQSELQELASLASTVDASAKSSINYWNSGAPTYRWVEVITDNYIKGPPGPPAFRSIALLNVGMYDAIVATWKAKEATGNLPSPDNHAGSSSFPSEHAAVAVVASEILSYVKPDLADSFRAKAEEAMQARMLSGLNTTSDIEAGKMIGMAVAEQIIAYAKSDGSDLPWEFTKPEDSLYSVENPVFPVTGLWKTMAMDNGAQFRVPAPPAYDSAELKAQLDEIKAVDMSSPAVIFEATNAARFADSYPYWFNLTNQLLFENNQADNAPYVALIYAGIGVAVYDSVVGCFESKYAYAYGRPSHVDSSIKPLIPVPPHPSYPSAHSCINSAMGNTFAHFFPEHTELALAKAEQSGQSRILAGIHYQMDNTTGQELGRQVAAVVIDKLNVLSGN